MTTKEKWLGYAEMLDAFRVVPRIMVIGFGYLVWHTVEWFIGLENPNTQQAALVSTVAGLIAPVTAFYFNTGRKWESK